MSSTHGWTTWDPSSIAVWEHLPSGLRCRLVLQDEAGQQIQPESWAPLEDFLPDDAGHSLAHLLVNAGGAQVEVECGGEGDVAACHILDIQGQVTARWEVDGPREGWQVAVEEMDVAVAPEGAAIPADINAFLRDQHDAVRLSLPVGEGVLADTLEIMEADLASNTFMLPETDELITLSRHAVEASGAWKIPNWQTFLNALGIAYVDPALALANCRTALKHLAVEDILGIEATAAGARSDLSNPPVASYCIWKIFQLTGDEELLREAMPVLLRWHNWWRPARDPNANQALSWASDEEAGMPGHPLYTEAVRDENSGVLMLDDVGLSSLWALDAAALMRMALHFDDMELSTHLEAEVQAVADHLNLALWDQYNGLFHSIDWKLRTTSHESATIFLTLLAGIPNGIRAQRLVNEHLAQEFAAPYLVPTVSVSDGAFTDQQPWRGRVSALLNYLICEGLRHYGEDLWAERIALSGLTLMKHGWNAKHQIYDSFNAQTGSGDDLAQDPMAPSGVLLGAQGIGLLIDLEPWDGMRLGNLSGIEMALNGFMLHGDRYDLASGPWGFSVRRNGKPWIETDRPVILRNISCGERDISLHAKIAGGGPLTLRFFGYAPGQEISVKVNGRLNTVTVSPTGELECSVELPPAPDVGGPGMSRVA
ncbi:MAG: MGH1-like glycoside hydrolase domain-containing protein [Armatimonadota bacterium]